MFLSNGQVSRLGRLHVVALSSPTEPQTHGIRPFLPGHLYSTSPTAPRPAIWSKIMAIPSPTCQCAEITLLRMAILCKEYKNSSACMCFIKRRSRTRPAHVTSLSHHHNNAPIARRPKSRYSLPHTMPPVWAHGQGKPS